MSKVVWDPKELKKKTELPETFEGVVTDYEWEETDWGDRLKLYIKPIGEGFEDMDAIKWRYRYNEKENSVWGRFIKSIQLSGLSISSEEELVGKKFIWEFMTLVFGINRNGEEISTKTLMPMEYRGVVDLDTTVSDNGPVWNDSSLKNALMNLNKRQTIDEFISAMDIPPMMKKRVIALAAALDAEEEITFQPETMEIAPLKQ